jgi:hypothetical protein
VNSLGKWHQDCYSRHLVATETVNTDTYMQRVLEGVDSSAECLALVMSFWLPNTVEGSHVRPEAEGHDGSLMDNHHL